MTTVDQAAQHFAEEEAFPDDARVEETDRCRAYALTPGGVPEEIHADGLFLELPGGLGAYVMLTHSGGAQGIRLRSFPNCGDGYLTVFSLKTGCCNQLEVHVAKHRCRPASDS